MAKLAIAHLNDGKHSFVRHLSVYLVVRNKAKLLVRNHCRPGNLPPNDYHVSHGGLQNIAVQ